MKKILLFILLNLISLIATAEIKATLDTTQVHLNQTVQLTLSQDQAANNSAPDLSALRNDFDILGTSRQLSYSLINGQSQSTSQWVIMLRAKKPGKIQIAPIPWGQEKSQALTLTVLDSIDPQEEVSSANKSDHDLLLQAKTQEKKAYINQEIRYIVRVYNAKSLLDAAYQEPEVKDALIIRLNEVPHYQAVKNHKTYLVTEQSYAIFPQKSGILKIKAPIFTALLAGSDEPLKVSDKTLSLPILAIPKAYQGKSWLPAKQVKLSEHYENAAQSLSQDSTLTRVIHIEGTGVPAQLLPEIKLDNTDAYQLYIEKGKERNVIKQGELVGSREIKITYLLTHAGQLTLPEFKLPWFNTLTEKEEIATLAPRSLLIQTSNASTPSIKSSHILPQQSSSASKSLWPWILVLLLALSWLITLILWGLQKRSSPSKQYKKALDELKAACACASPERAHAALLHWARLYWPNAKILNLAEIKELCDSAALQQEILLLSRCLYQEGERKSWNGQRLLDAVLTLKPKASKKRVVDPLSAINP
jgi:hypothetical protein